MRSILSVVLLLVFSGVSAGTADPPEDLTKWVRTPLTKKNQGYWDRANHDLKNDWFVFLRGDRPSVRLKTEAERSRRGDGLPLPFTIEGGTAAEGLYGRRFSAKVADGWIVGFNAGEWGAGLWWFSPDGKTRAKISKDHVIGFVETDAGLLALEGLAHLGSSLGQVIRLSKGKDDLWHSESFVDLEGAPAACAKESDGSLVVATYDRLLRVHPASKKMDVLVEDAYWGNLHPDSMISSPSGTIYLGMRHGVVEVAKEAENYKVNWLIPYAHYDGASETISKKVR